MIREAFKDLARLRQIAGIVGRHGFGELVERTRLRERLGLRAEELAASPEQQRESTARRFRELLVDLGPTFIKLGQVLSTRADLVPRAIVAELSSLQDSVAPMTEAEVRAEIEAGLGRPVAELFAELTPEPLASASIAQVHRARTKDGQEVVVKIQRPNLRAKIGTDLDLLYYLARLLEAVVEEVGLYSPTGIVEEFDKAIQEELDFVAEARNLEAFREKNDARPQIVIPTVRPELSCRTVLTMEYLRGVKITEIQDPQQRQALAQLVVELSFQELFEDGLFHGDPHPGNLLVLDDGRVGLLDLGVVGRLSPQMKQTLVILTLAIALRDADSVARLLYRVGIPDARTDLAAFRRDIEQVLARYLGKSLDQVDAASLLADLFDLAVRYRIKVPKEYALLSRAAITIEGILRQLDPKLDIAAAALPSLRRSMFSLLGGMGGSASLEGGLLRGVLRIQELTQDVPAQLSQVLMDLGGGKFMVNVQAQAFTEIVAALRRLAVVVLGSSLGASLVLGAFFSLSRQPWSFHGIPVLGTVAIALAAMLFGATASWYFVSVRLRKIRISRWVRGRGDS